MHTLHRDGAKQPSESECVSHADHNSSSDSSPGQPGQPGQLDYKQAARDMTDEEVVAIRSAELDSEVVAAANRAFGPQITWKRWLIIIAVLLAVMVVSMCLGHYSMNPADMFGTIYHVIFDPNGPWDKGLEISVMNVRLPRVLIVVLVGAALAVAGASYQGMFKNPLVSPDLLGASAGASLGACIAMLLDMSGFQVQVMAFVFSLAAVGLAVWLTRIVKSDALLGLVLGGILVSTLFQSGTSIVKLMADADDKLPQITFWLMGSFNDVKWDDFLLILIPMIVGFAILLAERWKLNVMSFGEEEARALGVNTARVRLAVIFAATLLTASSVAAAGIIGYVGLVVPHLARAIVGPNYRSLLPASMIIGAAFLLVVDDFARLLFATELPIGILTSIVGVPFFIFIYRRNLKGW